MSIPAEPVQSLRLPPEAVQRRHLAAEVHARPYESVVTPGSVLSLAILRSGKDHDAHCLAHLAKLGGTAIDPSSDSTHLRLQYQGIRVKWERHTEFFSYTFFSDSGVLELQQCFDTSWLNALPPLWLESLPGTLISATQIALVACPGEPPHVRTVAPLFDNDVLVGNRIAQGSATVVTNLRLHEGRTRFLIFDHALNRRRAGRTAQRLIEIDTYRMMALLSLPVAVQRMGELRAEENELACLIERFRNSSDGDEQLLGELVDLAARVEHAMADHGARFSATRAYSRIVDRRLVELREIQVPGLQPLSEFLERRFKPAVDSCAAAAARQIQLSQRVSRAAQLLQTRSEVERERQNQALLASMDRRQGLQLRLQETVEGLSVIAMTYYGVGLAGYVFKPIAKWCGISESLIGLFAVPVIGMLVLLSMRRIRRALASSAVPH